MSAVTLRKRPDGIAVLTFDTPDSTVNLLSVKVLEEIPPLLDDIEADDDVRAGVVASGKRGTFIAGANLEQILGFRAPEEGERFSRRGQALLDRMAASRKPFVAAISGAALGGGLEVALACRARVAVDDPKTVLALPEVTLGLLPAGGGTQRLPRTIGLPEALPAMLTGKRLRAGTARRLGLVDALVAEPGLLEAAARLALSLVEGRVASRRPRRTLVNRLLETAVGRPFLFRRARRSVLARTRGHYPAPLSILDCAAVGYAQGMHAGLEREAALFGRLAAGPEAKSLIGLFDATQRLKKPLPGPEPSAVRKVAVIGGGFMGTGIVAVSLPHVPVVVQDVSSAVLERCEASVREGLEHRAASGAITADGLREQLARLETTTDPSRLAGVDLVIEAVFEDLELKRRVLAEAENHIPAAAVFASNTSALPIAAIAERASHPERVIGMHYFSPVTKMPLLELVVAEKTAPHAVATARAFAVRQGKTVIVVRDGPGFYTSRILSPFLNEAMILLEEGARVEDVDRVVRDYGFPVGPLTLLDEVGIDVAAHVTRNFGKLYADRGLGGSAALVRLHDAGYAGRKNRRGFYRYDGRRRRSRQVNDEVYGLLGGRPRRPCPAREIARRCALLMLNEAVHCLQEGIISGPRDGDVGAVLGLGYPAFLGGPFRHADALGTAALVVEMEGLRASHGARFEPAPVLREMASEDRRFYEP